MKEFASECEWFCEWKTQNSSSLRRFLANGSLRQNALAIANAMAWCTQNRTGSVFALPIRCNNFRLTGNQAVLGKTRERGMHYRSWKKGIHPEREKEAVFPRWYAFFGNLQKRGRRNGVASFFFFFFFSFFACFLPFFFLRFQKQENQETPFARPLLRKPDFLPCSIWHISATGRPSCRGPSSTR